MRPAITMWTVNLSRDFGGERWRWPRLQTWRAGGTRHVRVGWHDTAWGVHWVRQEMTRDEVDQVVAASRRQSREETYSR